MNQGTLEAIAYLATVYGTELPEERTFLYYAELEDLPTAALTEAVREIARTSKWFPTIAEIRETTKAILFLNQPAITARTDQRIILDGVPHLQGEDEYGNFRWEPVT